MYICSVHVHVFTFIYLFFSAVPNLTMRLILIGHYHKGKSTILRMLQGRKKKDIMSGFYARLGSITLEESPPIEHGVCLYICTCIHLCLCVCIHVYTCVVVCIYECLYLCVNVYLCLMVYLCMSSCIYVCVYVHVFVYILIHM